MQVLDLSTDRQATKRDLILLLLASISCVFILTISLGESAPTSGYVSGLKRLILVGLLAVAGSIGVVLMWSTVSAARRVMARAEGEMNELRRSLAAAEAIIKAEPQVLVYWEYGQNLRVVANTLTTVAGLPTDEPELLRFGGWLEPKSAEQLKAALDLLFAEGTSFNLILRTVTGGHLEADGRSAGGRAVLRLKDVAGTKRALLRVIDQHQRLSRDIRAGRALLDALPMPVWLRGRDGSIEWVNSAYIAAVEASDLEDVKSRQIELLERQQRAMVGTGLKAAPIFRKRKQLNIGGDRKAHDVIVVSLDDAVVGVAIDVAAIETARGQLDREVAAFDRTLDKVASAVAIFGPDQRLAFFNGAYARLWQLDRKWLASSPTDGEILDRLRELSRLPAIVDYRVWKRRWVSVGQSGAPIEDWWHLPDGRMVHVIAEQRPDGGVTCLYDDATERLALESKFRTLIDVQKETLDSLKEGVALFGPDGRLKLFNTAFAGIWKLSRSALDEGPHIDKIVHQARVLFDDDRTWRSLSNLVTSFADEREALDGEMVRADGSVIDFATAPLPDGATLITFSDVTATRHYERALVERNEALVAADRLKNQFISHVSYELRTPLTNIIGFGELLADPRTGPLIEKQRDYLNDISTSSRTLLAVIDDILDLATIDAGALELKLAPAGIRGIIEASILGIRELAARDGIDIKVEIAPDVRDFIADEGRVRQVLFNLLSNSIGFSTRGQTVTLTCRREDGMIAFAVEDQGAGIPAEQQPRVFERFVSRTQGSKHRGAGLGLSIVKSLVELHGGDAKLASQPGQGTRVTVRFPERSDDPPTGRPALAVDQQLSRA